MTSRKLIVFAFVNLLTLAVSIALAFAVSLPFAMLGGYIASQGFDQYNTQTPIAGVVQGAGILVGVYGGFLAAFLVSLIAIFFFVKRAIEKRFFPREKTPKPFVTMDI